MLELQPYQLPQLPDEEASSIYERLRDAERRLASPSLLVEGYRNGAAQVDDEVLVVNGARGVLLTSEHATDHMRKKLREPTNRRFKPADYGTAAVGALLQEDSQVSFITTLGRQTMDPNHDAEHPLKEQMRLALQDRAVQAHVSLHGLAPRRISSIADAREYGAILGIGNAPTPETAALAECLRQRGAEYDIRVGVNQPILRFEPGTNVPLCNEDGSLKTVTFAAAKSGTTRAFAQMVAEEAHRPLAAIQFEISTTHRFVPDDHSYNRDRKTRQMNLYAGYLFLRDCLELLAPVK